MNKTLLLFAVLAIGAGTIVSSCTKNKNSKATASVVQMTYGGINHVFSSTGLIHEQGISTVDGTELGTPSTLVLSYAGFGKGMYRMGPGSQNQLSIDISGKVYTTGRSRAAGAISINKIDTLLTTVSGTFSGSLVNYADSNDVLDVANGYVSVKY